MSEEQMVANLLDNMMLGGGGPDDKAAKWVDNFEDPLEDTYRDVWGAIVLWNNKSQCDYRENTSS